MINAYEKNWNPCECNIKEYISKTTIENTKERVVKYIESYLERNLKRNVCNERTVSFLSALLERDILLNKTHVVKDGSGRSCVVLVRPDGYCVTRIGDRKVYDEVAENNGDYNIEKLLNHFEDNAETFFLNMTDETWTEVHLWMEEMSSHGWNELDDYDGYDRYDHAD